MSITTQQRDLNVIGIFREIWMAKLFLIFGLCLGLLTAFTFIYLAEPRVEARMVVGPADRMDISMQSQYQEGQSSYLVKPNETQLSQEGIPHFVRFQAMMRGASVAGLLLRDERIVDGLSRDRMFAFEDEPKQEPMSATELSDYIAKRVEVDPFGETTLRTLRYRHHDPVFAAYFLQQVHRVSDQLIRADLRSQIDQRIVYLERVIAKTMNPEQRRVMTNLLLEQERGRMLISMDGPVAAIVVDPPVAGDRIVWPDPYLFFGGLGLIGMMLGYFLYGLVPYSEEENYAMLSYDDVVEEMLEEVSADVDDLRGEDLQHSPKRPLKYGSWFQDVPENENENDRSGELRAVRRYSDAAE